MWRQKSYVLAMMLLLVNVGYSNRAPLELTVQTHLGAGFFCEFLKVVNHILHFEDENLVRVVPDWTFEFFPYKDKPHENGWGLYFEPIEIADYDNQIPLRKECGGGGWHELHDQLCGDVWVLYDKYLPYRIAVHERIKKYIEIKKHILEKVDAFYQKNMSNQVCIGVHVRFAAAHNGEVPGGHPSLDNYIAEVDALIKKHDQPIKIFLATDSHAVINHFKNHYPASMLAHIDAFRAVGSEDPHLIYENANYWTSHPEHFHQKKPGYYGGETTLLDGLLLAKCDYLIHTTSNVSTFVSFMNPHIKSIYLPKSTRASACRLKNTPAEMSVKNKWHLHLT